MHAINLPWQSWRYRSPSQGYPSLLPNEYYSEDSVVLDRLVNDIIKPTLVTSTICTPVGLLLPFEKLLSKLLGFAFWARDVHECCFPYRAENEDAAPDTVPLIVKNAGWTLAHWDLASKTICEWWRFVNNMGNQTVDVVTRDPEDSRNAESEHCSHHLLFQCPCAHVF